MIKKVRKIVFKLLRIILILLFLLFVILSIPSVQSKLAKQATDYINEKFNTNIVVKKIDLSFLGSVQLKDIEIRDHHKDTLIFVKKLNTSLLNAKSILDNNLNLGDATIDEGYFYMRKYKGEKEDNLNVFINLFTKDKPRDSLRPFTLSTENIYVDNLIYKYTDENKKG